MEKKCRIFFPRVWEDVDNADTQRLRVYGGWLVFSKVGEGGECMAFVPDPEHKWVLCPEKTCKKD